MRSLPETSISPLIQWLGGQDEFVFLDCARGGREEHRSFLFTGPLRWLSCTEPGQAYAFLEEADALCRQGYFLAGWIAYEFGYLLESSLEPLCPPVHDPYALLGVFAEPLIIDHLAEQPIPQELLVRINKGDGGVIGQERIGGCTPSMTKEEYLQAVDRIKDYILAGDTYQVNYTLKLRFDFAGDLARLYGLLRRGQSVPYGAWIRQGGRDIMSFSPELFFRADRDRITVRPMKGTMKRGRNLAEDELQRQLLREDIKNRSENVMIVDLLRNDLGRLLHTVGGGKVRPRSLFDVEVYDTILQMTSTIDGIPSRSSQPGLKEIMKALFPCGSVTGAPKIRTMEIIRELEKEPRGVYCGAVGFSGPRESVFNVPIRTVVLAEGRGEMGIGSGIIHDSDPEAEWRESLLKARFLTNQPPDFQLIETLLWQPGSGYWLLAEHMERLADSAAYFLIPHDREEVESLLAEEALPFAEARRVRVLLYRDGSIQISSTELERNVRSLYVPTVSTDPLLKVVFSRHPTSPDTIHLYHKTTNRQLYLEQRRNALKEGYYEVLFVNRDGEVTEGSISNIFIAVGDRLLTPPVRCGLLPGTFRRHLMDQGTAEEQVLTKRDVREARAVYVGNSVRGLVQVEVEEG